MKPCVFWAVVFGICALLLFIPDKWINTRTRKNNGLVLLVIIASLAGMQSYYQVTAPALLIALFSLCLSYRQARRSSRSTSA